MNSASVAAENVNNIKNIRSLCFFLFDYVEFLVSGDDLLVYFNLMRLLGKETSPVIYSRITDHFYDVASVSALCCSLFHGETLTFVAELRIEK